LPDDWITVEDAKAKLWKAGNSSLLPTIAGYGLSIKAVEATPISIPRNACGVAIN
jgi:hypothetical protein